MIHKIPKSLIQATILRILNTIELDILLQRKGFHLKQVEETVKYSIAKEIKQLILLLYFA